MGYVLFRGVHTEKSTSPVKPMLTRTHAFSAQLRQPCVCTRAYGNGWAYRHKMAHGHTSQPHPLNLRSTFALGAKRQSSVPPLVCWQLPSFARTHTIQDNTRAPLLPPIPLCDGQQQGHARRKGHMLAPTTMMQLCNNNLMPRSQLNDQRVPHQGVANKVALSS